MQQIAGIETVAVDKEGLIATGADINQFTVGDKLAVMRYPEKGNNSFLEKAR